MSGGGSSVKNAASPVATPAAMPQIISAGLPNVAQPYSSPYSAVRTNPAAQSYNPLAARGGVNFNSGQQPALPRAQNNWLQQYMQQQQTKHNDLQQQRMEQQRMEQQRMEQARAEQSLLPRNFYNWSTAERDGN